jgi:hypothetical protein
MPDLRKLEFIVAEREIGFGFIVLGLLAMFVPLATIIICVILGSSFILIWRKKEKDAETARLKEEEKIKEARSVA